MDVGFPRVFDAADLSMGAQLMHALAVGSADDQAANTFAALLQHGEWVLPLVAIQGVPADFLIAPLRAWVRSIPEDRIKQLPEYQIFYLQIIHIILRTQNEANGVFLIELLRGLPVPDRSPAIEKELLGCVQLAFEKPGNSEHRTLLTSAAVLRFLIDHSLEAITNQIAVGDQNANFHFPILLLKVYAFCIFLPEVARDAVKQNIIRVLEKVPVLAGETEALVEFVEREINKFGRKFSNPPFIFDQVLVACLSARYREELKKQRAVSGSFWEFLVDKCASSYLWLQDHYSRHEKRLEPHRRSVMAYYTALLCATPVIALQKISSYVPRRLEMTWQNRFHADYADPIRQVAITLQVNFLRQQYQEDRFIKIAQKTVATLAREHPNDYPLIFKLLHHPQSSIQGAEGSLLQDMLKHVNHDEKMEPEVIRWNIRQGYSLRETGDKTVTQEPVKAFLRASYTTFLRGLEGHFEHLESIIQRHPEWQPVYQQMNSHAMSHSSTTGSITGSLAEQDASTELSDQEGHPPLYPQLSGQTERELMPVTSNTKEVEPETETETGMAANPKHGILDQLQTVEVRGEPLALHQWFYLNELREMVQAALADPLDPLAVIFMQWQHQYPVAITICERSKTILGFVGVGTSEIGKILRQHCVLEDATAFELFALEQLFAQSKAQQTVDETALQDIKVEGYQPIPSAPDAEGAVNEPSEGVVPQPEGPRPSAPPAEPELEQKIEHPSEEPARAVVGGEVAQPGGEQEGELDDVGPDANPAHVELFVPHAEAPGFPAAAAGNEQQQVHGMDPHQDEDPQPGAAGLEAERELPAQAVVSGAHAGFFSVKTALWAGGAALAALGVYKIISGRPGANQS
jgi:hypothetical protein